MVADEATNENLKDRHFKTLAICELILRSAGLANIIRL